jgi:hypothetical protein
MSRTVYLLGVGLALVGLAFVLTDALLWEPGVTEANFHRIRPRMTLVEVEALLGGPGKVFRLQHANELWDPQLEYFWLSDGRGIVECVDRKGRPPRGSWPGFRCWSGERGRLAVGVDGKGRVQLVDWYPRRDTQPSPLARLRARLGW